MIKELSEIKQLIKSELSYVGIFFKLPCGENSIMVAFNNVEQSLIKEFKDFVGEDFNVGKIKSEQSEYVIITSKLI